MGAETRGWTIGVGEEQLMADTYVFSDDNMSKVLGPNDKNLAYLELLLGCDISARGNTISALKPRDGFLEFMRSLENAAKKRGELSESEIYMEFQLLNEPFVDLERPELSSKSDKRQITVLGKSVWPKSKAQRELFAALNDNQIVFASGPAGTGKTFIAIAWALEEVLSGKKNKIVLTRPVVEAGESLGFLPGDLSQKLNPYLKPLYDAMDYLLTPRDIKRLEDNGTIEIAPLAYMRGRSLNKSVVILDEAQNATSSQMKMFLTRIGESSKAIITGDPTQIDLPAKQESGFKEAMRILDGIDSITVVKFTHMDTVRSRIVREIVKAYSAEERNEDKF